MSKRTMTYDCYDYENFRSTVDACLSIGAVLNKHLTWFTRGAEIDQRVHQFLQQKKCVVVLRDNEGTGKLVGVVVTDNKKNTFGANCGKVVEVLYDRDDRVSKKRLNKVKGFFSGDKDNKGYVDSFTKHRSAYNAPAR